MEYADLAPLLAEARSKLLGNGIRIRPDHWQACLGDDLVDMLQEGRREEAEAVLMERLMLGAECDCHRRSLCKMWEDLAVNGHS